MIKRVGAVLLGLFVVISMTGCYSKPESGEIGVVRNGGPFDNHKIRQIVPNGAGNTWVGLYSQTHFYPVNTQQRFFRMATCDEGGGPVKCDGADSLGVTVPTADGVEVTIEGTFYLNTVFGDPTADPQNTKCEANVGGGTGDCLLKAFDTQFATRTFGGKHPYDGNDGWSKFLAAIVEPVIGNNLRETIAGVSCAELVSSCALVQNGGNGTVNLTKKNNQSNVAKIQDLVNENLKTDLKETLKQDYFANIRFNLSQVALPLKVQDAIDTAQAAFAEVSQAQAKVQAAKLEAKANEQRQSGYAKCPTCAQIDATKAIPDNITVWAPGGSYAVTGG